MILYFAYGSNLSKRAMRDRAPGARPLVAATLPEHRLTFESNEPHGAAEAYFANIKAAAASSVPGALYEVDAETLERLDAYEDVARGVYERTELTVACADGGLRAAVVYRMPCAERAPREGPASEAQMRQIREGYADWGLDLRVLSRATRSIPSTRS